MIYDFNLWSKEVTFSFIRRSFVVHCPFKKCLQTFIHRLQECFLLLGFEPIMISSFNFKMYDFKLQTQATRQSFFLWLTFIIEFVGR